MVFKHPHKYGLLAMVSKKDYKQFEVYRKALEPYVKFFMEEDFLDDVAPQHLSLCYFSYPEKYPEDYVKKLVPKINSIIKKYLPLKVEVKGLIGGWDAGLGVSAILWNIVNFEKVKKMHDEIVFSLKGDIEHFNDPEMDFTPHIGVALGKDENIQQLKRIIRQSKKDKSVELTIDRFYIFYPNGPKEIFRAS